MQATSREVGYRSLVMSELAAKYMNPVDQRTFYLVVYGPPGIGKSSYAIKLLRELYREDAWKPYLVFKPDQFVSLVGRLLDEKRRCPMIVWDDAGLWTYALDWYDPWVKAATKFLNVARTVTAGLVFTTPSLAMLQGRMMRMEGMNVGKVVKATKAVPTKRMVRIYRNNLAPWGRRYVTEWAEENFDVMLPDDVFNYYKPIREGYAREAKDLMVKSLKSLDKPLDDG